MPESLNYSTGNDGTKILTGLTPDQYSEWEARGTLPAVEEEQTEAESSPAPRQDKAESAEPKAEPATAKQEETRSRGKGAEERIKGLLAEVKAKDQELSELRKQMKSGEKPATPAEKAAVTEASKETKSLREKLLAIANGDTSKYTKYEEMTADMIQAALAEVDSLVEAALDKRTKAELEKRESTLKSEREAKQEEVNAQIAEGWKKRVEEATVKYGKRFDELVRDTAIPVKQGTVVDAYILDSEHGTDIFWHLAKDEAGRRELDRINSLSPLHQALALRDLELTLYPPANSRRPALKPAREVAGSGSAAVNEVRRAVESKNFAEFERIQNAKDAARAKGR